MGTCATCGRILLVVINIFFLLFGLVFFGAGLFVRFGTDIINKYVDDVIKNLETSLSQSGFGTVDLSNFSLSDVLEGLAIGLICFGLFLIIITILGCCGACYKLSILLIVYVVICIVLLIGQIIIIGILYGSPDTLKDPAKESLKEGIKKDYQGFNGTNLESIAWNVVHQQVDCCGVDSYADFTGASKWITDYTSSGAGVTLKTPISCCKTLPSSENYDCASTTGATDSNNNMNKGCYDEIWDLTINNTAIVAGTLAGVAIFQLLLLVYAIVLICENAKSKRAVSPKLDKKRNPYHGKSYGNQISPNKGHDKNINF